MPTRSASRCDLLETPVEALEVGDGSVCLTLAPFELVTLRLGVDPVA
ncbi:MAG: glycosyl hydrolase-related protein [Actinomycetota bacterium]